uniref:Alpha-1,6-mannosyl-glycoprotein 6-beta-N-acetylglucosaminyltransferase n=1 Tax=Heligmosomoides polygyrus TaxID=6339 RepID=A0A183F741_HELPZ
LERCNKRLNVGMDMVNAHMAFGSIDVPSVMERRDLELFCQLDRQHTQCVDECGYSVQFNLREFVCRKRFNEMAGHLPCYARAAPVLSRHCRPRCGEYLPLEHSPQGYAQRCRQLLCDHTCTNFIIDKVCPANEARRAGRFLLEFTRLQVSEILKFRGGD